MNDKSRHAEDIASLFSAFGGDAGRYQEFEQPPTSGAAPDWPLLQTLGAGAQEAAAAAPLAAPLAQALAPDPSVRSDPIFQPARPPAAPAADPAPAPAHAVATPAGAAPSAAAAAPSVPAPAPSDATAGTPLAVLFERLAAAPAADGRARHSLLAHWRPSP
ncbi:BcsR/BcsP family cellulose biosynthesis protein [Xenophilus sp. Marseille-Q4582]|uniref:BcsR/BcsP family cellulose biosynthesis protein n=1 Tax=Xenophilus sp. Marseille-Q4582 TaxID=2866600 RepID=UPI001CE3D96F|nr:BcsR/BcsP family cellulose biosynthesis protein [Xenophilus sp. Marseille-Q4582]